MIFRHPKTDYENKNEESEEQKYDFDSKISFIFVDAADHLICGSMMEGVEEAAAEKNVKIHNGASGKADDTVKALLNGELL